MVCGKVEGGSIEAIKLLEIHHQRTKTEKNKTISIYVENIQTMKLVRTHSHSTIMSCKILDGLYTTMSHGVILSARPLPSVRQSPAGPLTPDLQPQSTSHPAIRLSHGNGCSCRIKRYAICIYAYEVDPTNHLQQGGIF